MLPANADHRGRGAGLPPCRLAYARRSGILNSAGIRERRAEARRQGGSPAPHALWLLLILALPCHAGTCPWMNAATASGFLGAPAAPSDTAPCTFIAASGQIRITVAPLRSPKDFPALKATCATPQTSLPAIGSEAILCGEESNRSIRIVGRVRDQAFTLLIRTSHASTSLREKARAAAEIVAGNLF